MKPTLLILTPRAKCSAEQSNYRSTLSPFDSDVSVDFRGGNGQSYKMAP